MAIEQPVLSCARIGRSAGLHKINAGLEVVVAQFGLRGLMPPYGLATAMGLLCPGQIRAGRRNAGLLGRRV